MNRKNHPKIYKCPDFYSDEGKEADTFETWQGTIYTFSGKLNQIGSKFPGGVLPYMGYIGMCGPKGYGFSAVLVINWVSILAILLPFWS